MGNTTVSQIGDHDYRPSFSPHPTPFKGVVAHPSTVGGSALQGAPVAVGEVATPRCMHVLRFSINIPS